MDESDTPYTPGTEEQLWEELDRVVATQCPAHAHETIDDALRTWLQLASQCRLEFSESEDDVASCAQRLLDGRLFSANEQYVRMQIMYSLLQEDDTAPLYVIASFLLLDGRTEESTFRRMIDEGCFNRLVDLINGRKDEDPGLHRLLLELVYEMSRIEKLRPEDLMHVDDSFVNYMFQLIEGLSYDAHDPYHYPVIRVLLVLNEQYMVASASAVTDPSTQAAPAPLTNRIVKCLSLYGAHYRTFGENIILLLNRETETSLQLLILKLLYLLFTTKATYEYFYTNDLRVLLDVIIRNLLDLPHELMALRHTYLRVLYPLLAHTQLAHPPHYKRDEVLKVLRLLAGSDNAHFAPADDTTARLLDRVSKVKWLADEGGGCVANEDGAGEIARRLLGISLDAGDAASKISVVDVAAVTEKPGVQTPSRMADTVVDVGAQEEPASSSPGLGGSNTNNNDKNDAAPPRRARKPLPEVPKHRHGVPVVHVAANGSGNANGNVGAPAKKKIPPKTPPPRRRGGIRSAVGGGGGAAAAAADAQPAP